MGDSQISISSRSMKTKLSRMIFQFGKCKRDWWDTRLQSLKSDLGKSIICLSLDCYCFLSHFVFFFTLYSSLHFSCSCCFYFWLNDNFSHQRRWQGFHLQSQCEEYRVSRIFSHQGQVIVSLTIEYLLLRRLIFR